FPELAGGPREIGPRGRDSHLLEPQRLETAAVVRERGAASIEPRLELLSGEGALRRRRLGFLQRRPDSLPFTRQRHGPLFGQARVFGQPHLLIRQLTDLHAHLLAALDESLDLALNLLDSLPEVGEAVLHLLLRRALRGLASAEAGQADPQRALAVAQAIELSPEAVALGGQRRVIPGEDRERERLLLRVEALVLPG